MPRSIEELTFRVQIARLSVKIVEDADDADPRKASALEKYRGQLIKLEEELAEAQRLDIHAPLPVVPADPEIIDPDQPPPVVVQLKTARLFGEGGNHV